VDGAPFFRPLTPASKTPASKIQLTTAPPTAPPAMRYSSDELLAKSCVASLLPSVSSDTAFSATLPDVGHHALTRHRIHPEAYIAYAFGATHLTDAYSAAFTLPDLLNYLVAGAQLDHLHLHLHRLLTEKREADAQKTFSVIITVMTTVLIAGTILAEIFTIKSLA